MQIAIIFAGAVLRWPGCMIEASRVARRVERVSFDPPPVFIVGHWRSGTTLLHNLMSRDPGFCFPTIVDVLRPYDFYPNPFGFVTRRIVLRFLPRTRPMDDVRLDPESPQEEELALCHHGCPFLFQLCLFPEADDFSVRGGSPVRGRGPRDRSVVARRPSILPGETGGA